MKTYNTIEVTNSIKKFLKERVDLLHLHNICRRAKLNHGLAWELLHNKQKSLSYITIKKLEPVLISLGWNINQNYNSDKISAYDLNGQGFIDLNKLNEDRKTEWSILEIKKIVSQYYGISICELDKDTRKREIVEARQIAMYFAKRLTKCSLTIIGAQIGDKDHSTCLWGINQVHNFIETNINFALKIKKIEALLKI